jgi:hypothetical protein
MRIPKAILLLIVAFLLSNCDKLLDSGNITDPDNSENSEVNFQYRSTIEVGGEGAAEISAYDSESNKLFVINGAAAQISVYTLSDLDNPDEEAAIDVSEYGVPNSVAVHDGQLAVAVESKVSQNPGSVLLYNTGDQQLIDEFTVGALPDMVTFTGDGSAILSANEGKR